MKQLLIFFSLLISNAVYADANFSCKPFGESVNSVRFGVRANDVTWFQTALGEHSTQVSPDKILEDGSKEFSFLVDTANDTRTYIAVVVRNETLVSAVEWLAGNDSDNYYGRSTETLIVCARK